MSDPTTKTTRSRLALVAIAMLLAAGVAFAGAIVHDSALRSTRPGGGDPTWFKTGLTGNHSKTSATPVDLQYVQGGDVLLRVNVRGSASGGTGTIEVWTSDQTTGSLDDARVQSQTFTLGTDNRAATGYQPAQPLYFDIAGDVAYDVRLVALSSGTADLKATTLGAGSKAAE